MQPQNPNNYWQPGDQPTPATPPQPVGPAPIPTPPPAPVPQQPVAPAPQPAPVAPPQATLIPQAPVAVQPLSAPVAPSQPVAPASPQDFTETEEFAPQESDPAEPEASESEQEDTEHAVNWQAKEYIHQEKGGLWFILFTVVLVVLLAAAILLMKSWSFAVLLVVIAIVIVTLSKRPPRVLSYSLTNKGLHIGDTLHAFRDFKSFGVIRDGEEFSVMLIPTKRFLPGVTVYFPETSGEQIVDMLGARLPMQELHLDWLDRFVRKLRL